MLPAPRGGKTRLKLIWVITDSLRVAPRFQIASPLSGLDVSSTAFSGTKGQVGHTDYICRRVRRQMHLTATVSHMTFSNAYMKAF